MKQARDPEQSIIRKQIMAMDRKTLSREIANSIKRLNRKMKSLESSGYDRYSTSYGKIRDFNEAVSGTHYFSSSKLANATLDERRDYLFQLRKYEKYEGMTKKSIIESLQKSAEKLNQKGIDVTASDLMKINEYMRDWREFIRHSNIADMFTSDEAREIFTMQSSQNLNRNQFDMFMRELEKFNTGTYNKMDFPIFLKTYDFKAGKPIAETTSGIKFNPLNGKLIGDSGKYFKTSIRLDRSGENLIRWNSKKKMSESMNMPLSAFNKGSLYDYIRNDQKGTKQ